MKKAIDMWFFLSTWSAFWDRWTTKKTWVYSERADRYFVWHAWLICWYDDKEEVFRAVNSYGDKRWPYWWYFKVPYDMIWKIYSCLPFIDRDDSHLFSRFEEIQKVKQAVELLRKVYNSTTSEWVKSFLEKQQLGATFSTLYWTIIEVTVTHK